MLENPFLIEISAIFLIASTVGLILSKFKQPAIAAYILTGIILGPGILGLIKNYELINQLSEIGVIALLFTLGLEFSFDKFKQVKKIALFAGILQILITIFIVSVITKVMGFSNAQSLLLGSIVALSSTVIVLKTLTEMAQLDSLHGRIMLGILIIQDLSLIPIMIILPNLGIDSGAMLIPLLFAILKAGIFLALALILSLKVAPVVMNFITTTNKEILVLSSVAVAISTAIIANYFGVSLAIGAFVAGLSLSITAHSKQVIAEVIPFRDVFAMIFFVSIGMLMDINFFINHLPLITGIVAAIFIVKFIICFMVVYLAKYPGQTALWAGLSLFQVGEFSFVLAKVAASSKIIDQNLYSLIIISALITMLLTPFIIKLVPTIISKLQNIHLWNKHFKGKIQIENPKSGMQDHTIICGYGPIGRSVAKILKLYGEKFTVIELNNKTIKQLKHESIPAIYGDATHSDILKHAHIQSAKTIVITLPDAKSCEMATINARKSNEDIYIIVRSRYQTDINKLYQAGANVVIYEEYETSMAIVGSTLTKLGYPISDIEATAELIRSNNCQLLQESYSSQDFNSKKMGIFADNQVEWIKIPHNSPLAGKTLGDSSIRALTGASIITIIKNNKSITNPPAQINLDKEDILIAIGSSEQLKSLKNIINI